MHYTNFKYIIRFFTFRLVVFMLLFLSLDGYSQPGAELGVFAGGSYYLGEYNPAGHFKDVKMAFGGIYRINLNDRYALRFGGIFSKIDTEEKILRGGDKILPPFKTSVTDLTGVLEFNFRSFLVPKIKESSRFSPYSFVGMGALMANKTVQVTIPFGVGVKIYLSGPFSLGVEWGGRKLFKDNLDSQEDIWGTGETNFIFNKDWLFTSGITLTYRFPMNPECRGYK